jgi:hypothetical protein
MIARALALVLVACGAAPVPREVEILPPNTEQACDRAVACEVFGPEQQPTCVACLEHLSPEAVEVVAKLLPKLPPLNEIDCETIAYVSEQYNLTKCVVERWYKP